MKDNLTTKDITQELKDAVAVYLDLKAKAENIRKRVDKVQRQVLVNVELYNDLEVEHGLDRERIADPNRTYLSQDESALEYYYEALDMNLREAGLKPADMSLDHCPALVAEHERVKAEWLLLDESAKMMDVYEGPGEFSNALLCTKDGLKKRQEFIDLTCQMVQSLPA